MPDDIITRADALARGLKRYFTGRPCKHGHIAERYAFSRACCICITISSIKWNTANPQKVRGIQRRYRAANRHNQVNREKDRRWRAANREKTQARQRRWRLANREKLVAGDARRREKKRIADARRRAAKPEIQQAKRAARRAAQSKPSWADKRAIEQIFAHRPVGHHVDHIVPLGGMTRVARTAEDDPICGLHVPWNLKYQLDSVNCKKQERMSSEEQMLCESGI
jgi:hypothetical protein